MKRILIVLFMAGALIMVNCGKEESEKLEEGKKTQEVKTPDKKVEPEMEKKEGEPDRITVQHLLVAFQGTLPGNTEITRTREAAKKLAYNLMERARGGEDFDKLVKEFTNDSHPGIYSMSNFGVDPDKDAKEYPRKGMVQAFGDVGFPLKVGEYGMADYDPKTSKYGYHLIKRIK